MLPRLRTMAEPIDELKQAVIRQKNLLDPSWMARAKKQRTERANQRMILLQRRILMSQKMNIPLPEVSPAMADKFIETGVALGVLTYDE